MAKGIPKRVAIVGGGALGSHVSMFLRNEVSHLKVIDCDRVEQKNTLSQFHGTRAIGKNKSESLKQVMQFLWEQKIESVPHKLTPDNAGQLLAGYDLVIDCLDNEAGRTAIQKSVRATGYPCLHGALAPNGQFGRVVWDENFKIDSEAGMGGATCEDGEHLPFIVIVSGYITRAAQVFIRTEKKIGFEIHPNGVTRT